MALLYLKFVIILITSSNISYYFNKDFFKVNLCLISTYTFILLYFSFLDLFVITNFFIHIFLTLNFIYFIFNYKKDKNLSFIFFLILILLLSHYFSPNGFLFWDEFAQWGIKPKEIFLNKSIYSDYITTNNKYWTIAIYHNLIIFGMKEYDEMAIILSQVFISLSCLMFIFSYFNEKKIINYLLIVLFFYFSSSIFNYGFFTVYLDLLVALYFLCLCLILFDKINLDLFDSFLITVLLSFLFLIKGISLFFGILIIVYLTYLVFLRKNGYKETLLILFSTFLIFFSYQVIIFYTEFGYHIKPELNYYGSKIDYNILNNYFLYSLLHNNVYEGKFLNLFFKIIEYLKYDLNIFNFLNFNFNYFFWIISLSTLSFIIIKSNKLKKSNYDLNIFLIIIFSFITYTFFIYYAYKNYFGPAEAASMSSFGRYFGIFLFFWLFILFFNFINIGTSNKSINIIKWSFFLIIIASSPGKTYENILNKFINLQDTYQSDIIKNKESIKTLSKYIPTNKKVYFVDQGKDEFYLRVARFIIYPIKSNQLCSSIAITKENQKGYDCLVSENKFKEILENYNYLFFLNSDNQIIINYSLQKKVKKIKSIKNMTLYELI